MNDIEPTDIYADDYDPDLSMLLDASLEREEFHRDEMVRWRNIRRMLEDRLPMDAIEEMAEIARRAWNK